MIRKKSCYEKISHWLYFKPFIHFRRKIKLEHPVLMMHVHLLIYSISTLSVVMIPYQIYGT